MKTILDLIAEWDDPIFQESLNRLYADLGDQEPEHWAQQLYVALCNEPSNVRSHTLNLDEKVCLQLLQDMVDAWEDSQEPDMLQEQIHETFGIQRLARTLYICMVMERAQSAYHVPMHAARFYGLHWYTKSHLDPGSLYARSFPEMYQELQQLLTQYPGSPTMNSCLYKLMYSPRLNLMQDSHLFKWSFPIFSEFVTLPKDNNTSHSFASLCSNDKTDDLDQKLSASGTAYVRLKEDSEKSDKLASSSDAIVRKFVDAYNDASLKERVARLYQDLGSQDPELWAKQMYTCINDDDRKARVANLNEDRKACLQLLYDMVDEWKKSTYSVEFEDSIKKVFQRGRLFRILQVCLVMDRARSLFNPAGAQHWYCELHFSKRTLPSEEHQEWMQRLETYDGIQTMNKRLFRLLYSDVLNLHEDRILAKWSKPLAALSPFSPAGTSTNGKLLDKKRGFIRAFDGEENKVSKNEPDHLSDTNEDSIEGRMISKRFRNNLHFVCGCSNFSILQNEKFSKVCREYFMSRPQVAGRGCSVRFEVANLLEVLHQEARRANSGNPTSRFQIWKKVFPKEGRLRECNWESARYVDISDNIGMLKRDIEWPLRKAKKGSSSGYGQELPSPR